MVHPARLWMVGWGHEAGTVRYRCTKPCMIEFGASLSLPRFFWNRFSDSRTKKTFVFKKTFLPKTKTKPAFTSLPPCSFVVRGSPLVPYSLAVLSCRFPGRSCRGGPILPGDRLFGVGCLTGGLGMAVPIRWHGWAWLRFGLSGRVSFSGVSVSLSAPVSCGSGSG